MRGLRTRSPCPSPAASPWPPSTRRRRTAPPAAPAFPQSSIVLKPKIKLVQLSSANSPLTVPIISPGGLASGGTPPLTLAYLTPLPLNTKSAHFNRIKKEMIKSGASPQAILPGIPFAYRVRRRNSAPASSAQTAEAQPVLAASSAAPAGPCLSQLCTSCSAPKNVFF